MPRITKKDIYSKYGIEFDGQHISGPAGRIPPVMVDGNSKIGKGVYHFSMLPGTALYDANITQYDEPAEYYSTLFHELGHSTGHASRLNRFTGDAAAAAFGSESYSREELVAEITAASILNELGLESGNTFRNSAAYVKSWSEHIKNDPMMFVTACGKAEKAVDLILHGEVATA